MEETPIVASWEGHCPICDQHTRFEARNSWFRDHLRCTTCPGGSIPRERALMLVIRQLVPNWPNSTIHESSPCNWGASAVLARDCPGYISTQLFKDVQRGQSKFGVRCEDLEQQTFADESFDLIDFPIGST